MEFDPLIQETSSGAKQVPSSVQPWRRVELSGFVMTKKLRRYSRRERLRRDIRMATARDHFERVGERGSIERGVRARLQEQHPNATVAEIEDAVRRIMTAGAARTTSEPLPALGVPADVQAARRAERRKMVDARRHLRRRQ